MPEYIKLRDLYGDDTPDESEILWQFVCSGEYEDTEFEIVEVDPVRLFNLKDKNGDSLKSALKDHAEPWQKKLVREYRDDIASGEDIGLLVVSSGNVVDGHHRLAALALEGVRKAKAVDLELPKPKGARPETSANPPRTTLYHVTKTSSVKSIVEHGIQPLYTSNWVTGTGKRYGEGEIFAFEHIADAMRWASHMDWELHQELGTGQISIVEFIKDGKWDVDTSDPISQLGRKGNWLKRFKPVPAANVVSSRPFTKAMVKKVVQSANPPKPKLNAAFDTWFGNSVVRNEDGSPLVVYHGTTKKFSVFKSSKHGHLGFHFGNRDQAEMALKNKKAELGANGGRIVQAYLSIQNPLISTDAGDWSNSYQTWITLDKALKGALGEYDFSLNSIPQQDRIERIILMLEGLGYDGIVYRNRIEGRGESWVAFRPDQIKSIDNDGTWDRDDPDIRSNPPPITIKQTKQTHSVFYEIEEDLFTGHLYFGARIDVDYEPLGASVFGLLKFAKDLYGSESVGKKGARQAQLLGIMRWKGHILGEEISDNLFSALMQLLQTAIEDARVSGAYMIYTVGPRDDEHSITDRNHIDLIEQSGFKATGAGTSATNEQIYMIDFKGASATNPPPHLISREYGGGPDPSNEDPQDRVTISIEQPEDITSEAIQDTKLDLFFDKISKFARGTPGVYKAFSLPSPDPVYSDPRTSELERHEPSHRPDVLVAMMFGITADQRLTSNREKHAEELSEVMSELIKAAFDEAGQRGAYGVFARGGFAEKHRLLVKNGFTPTGVRDGSGYGLYVKILGQPEQATNPPPIIIKREAIGQQIDPASDPEWLIQFSQEEDLFHNQGSSFANVHFRKVVAFLRSIPRLFEAFGLSPDVKFQNPSQMAARIEPVDVGLVPSPEVMSAFVQAAVREAESRGAIGVFATDDYLSGFWEKNGFKRTGVRSSNDHPVYVINFQEGSA